MNEQSQVSLNAAQYWIIEAVATDKWLLKNLGESVVERAFNRKGHGLKNEELLETLDYLFQDGYLFADRVLDLKTWDDEKFIPNYDELQRIFKEKQRHYIWYGLTDEGSALWETLLNPKWQEYMFSELSLDTGECSVSSGSKQMIDNYLSCSGVSDYIRPGTLHWKIIDNWEATYWKLLPKGYIVHFTVYEEKIEDFPYAESTEGWYANPFGNG